MKKKEEDGNNSIMTDHHSDPGYDPYRFNKLVDDAIGNKKEKEGEDTELSKLDKKIRKATEADLLRLMDEGKWSLISEFKYRRPELCEWVDELEYRYWDDHYARMSQWK